MPSRLGASGVSMKPAASAGRSRPGFSGVRTTCGVHDLGRQPGARQRIGQDIDGAHADDFGKQGRAGLEPFAA